jgi:uncharacterized membrane protein
MDKVSIDTALQTEYFHLQKTIEDFDGKAMTIKAWSVTFSLAVIVGAFASHAAAVLLIAATSSLLFWFLETIWKTFQLGFYARAEQIEGHFRGDTKLTSPNQIGAAWMERWNNTPWSEVRRLALWPHVALPHAAVVVVGIFVFILVNFGWLSL